MQLWVFSSCLWLQTPSRSLWQRQGEVVSGLEMSAGNNLLPGLFHGWGKNKILFRDALPDADQFDFSALANSASCLPSRICHGNRNKQIEKLENIVLIDCNSSHQWWNVTYSGLLCSMRYTTYTSKDTITWLSVFSRWKSHIIATREYWKCPYFVISQIVKWYFQYLTPKCGFHCCWTLITGNKKIAAQWDEEDLFLAQNGGKSRAAPIWEVGEGRGAL